jgi:hypothetical protein
MNVKCPYCGCCYNIQADFLPKPIGDIKLGYGWWLRCCQCQKKWWLKHSVVQLATNTPIRADIANKIDRISKLRKRKENIKNGWRKYLKWFAIASIVCTSLLVLHNRDRFKEYVVYKIKRLSENMLSRLRMIDVQYNLEQNSNSQDDVTLLVNGKIINDDKNVVKLNGVKVVVYDKNNNEIISWKDGNTWSGYIIQGETLDFATNHNMPKQNGSIKVEVSVY